MPAASTSTASTSLPISAAFVPRGCSALVFIAVTGKGNARTGIGRSTPRTRHRSSKDGTPGGTRTPNLRFWRPLLCQLSYWRIGETGSEAGADAARRSALATAAPGFRMYSLLDDFGHHAGADGAATFA